MKRLALAAEVKAQLRRLEWALRPAAATQRSAAMAWRPSGSGGERASALLPLLRDRSGQRTSRRL